MRTKPFLKSLFLASLISSLALTSCVEEEEGGKEKTNTVQVATGTAVIPVPPPVVATPDAGAVAFRAEFSADKAADIIAKIPWETVSDIESPGDKRAKKGGELISASTDFPSTLRILGKNSSTTFNTEMESLCYEVLLGFDNDKLRYEPFLADQWHLKEDKVTWFYHLNPLAKWPDGKPLTAADVVATWKLRVDPGIESPFDNDLWQKYYEPIALSPEVVVVRSKNKDWRLFYYFSGSFTILPAHILGNLSGAEYIKKFQFDFLPGSGPYEFGETDKQTAISFKRRENYWGWKHPGIEGLYNFDRIKYVFILDENLMRERFKKGEVDWYMENVARKWVEETNYDKVEMGWVQKRKVFTKQPDGVSGLFFNIRKPPFDDIRVRQAVAHLYNREKLIEKLFLNQYFPRHSWFVGLPYENPTNPRVKFDPEVAQKLLKEAGYERGDDGVLQKNGKKLEVDLNFTHPSSERIDTVFQEDLRAVGIKINLKKVDWATDIKEVGERNFLISNRAYSGVFFPNPEGQYHSKFADLPDNNNIFGYKNPVVDKLCEQYNEEFDAKKRVKLCQEIDGIVCNDYLAALGWYAPYDRVLYWDKFGQPDWYFGKYSYGDHRDISRMWWYDAEKDKTLKEAVSANKPLPYGHMDEKKAQEWSAAVAKGLPLAELPRGDVDIHYWDSH